MHVREMTFMGVPVWPPQWLSSGHTISNKAVLMDVKLVFGTDLLRIDIEQKGMHYLGIMLLEEEMRAACCQKLKEHIGKSLAEIAELQIERETPGTRRRRGWGQSPGRAAIRGS